VVSGQWPVVSDLFHILVTSLLVVVLGTVAGNLVYLWRVGRREAGGDDGELVSVCVPARDEAARIGACLEALERQTYPVLEVLVLDDGSSDGTGEIARGFEGRVAGLRVLEGEPLAEGWVGKPHACAALAREARGEWLLFVDADVALGPEGVRRGVALARGNRADLLTALPEQRLGSLAEALAIPLVYFAVAGFLPMFLMSRSRSARMAAASGQYMLFRREAYDAVGGHAAVRGEIVEDVALARAVRRAGRRLVIANGVGLATCRMYAGWGEVVEGFSKNAFAGLGRSVRNLALYILISAALFVAPPVGLAVAPSAWFAVETGLALAARAALAVAFRQPIWTVALHPAAVLLAIYVALRSAWLTHAGGGVRWRGRRYE
jgi:chlorobactene glucosyltransferase